MKERMRRFLESISIRDVDAFDMDFENCKKSSFDKNLFLFTVRKETPWDFPLLDEFINKLPNITTYKYEFTFIYTKKPLEEDISSLIKNWFFNNSYEELNASISFINEVIKVKFYNNENEEQYHKFLDLKDDLYSFLRFISYYYNIQVEFVPTKVEVNEEPIEVNLEKEMNDTNEEAEQIAMKVMEDNYSKMIQERRQAGLFKKGGYEFVPLKDMDENSGAVDFNGVVFEVDLRETRKGGLYGTIGVGDNETIDAINVKFISNHSNLKKEDLLGIKVGQNIRIKGKVDIDKYKHELYVMAHYFYILPETPLREDPSEEKRVELHLHTKMSEMDGVTTITDYCKLAKHMGHTAIAVTDHGVVQAFPEAQQAAKKYGIKILYGSELYVIDDDLFITKNPDHTRIDNAVYVCFDLETTGLSIKYDKITEFGAVKIKNGLVIDRMDFLINPEKKIPEKIEKKTNITNEMVKDKPTIKELLPTILDFCKDTVLVSHNIEFDYGMLNEAMMNNGFGKLTKPALDTLALSKYIFPEAFSHSLGSLCKRLEVSYDEESAHRADYDAEVLANCWLILRNNLIKEDKDADLVSLHTRPITQKHLRHLRGNHVCVLCKNRKALKDLYKIISFSHCDYMGSKPLVPKSLLEKYRKDLLVGSACFNGEVFYASTNRNMEALHEAVRMFDYIEIQPLENYSYLINMGEIPNEEMLKQYIKDIIQVANEEGKMICATGDAHYRDPSDKKFRDVYIANMAVGGVNHALNPYSRQRMQKNEGYYFENPDQHYRSTTEMLECFAWLGEEKAREYVITNTNKISDMCEVIIPIPDKLFTPTIDNCENLLRELCYTTAKSWYGDDFLTTTDPAKVFIRNRLDTELDGIIDNGYSVTYYIAHKLVKKSNEDGYIVGSRGSVGSSFAATMSGITEVNALPPHYRCPHCHKVIFYEGTEIRSGFDLPEMKCPDCGTTMIADGQNIPFQTFLGFAAEKVPDIDLNFPRDYQATAHQYTKVFLGADKVYRAGTISTVQFKTAFGYARKYFENQDIPPDKVRSSVLGYLAYGCQEVKRTTGQHPGGIVVVPREYDIYDFTPVQYPAGDVNAAWKTTHFDFHAIHDTILKLDMLGHLDPQAVAMMGRLTGVDSFTIPFNDKKVISLFSTDDALNLQHKYMEKDNGALAIPEFGTNFVRQMLRETEPKTFSDLLIISGLSHGTDVWNNNAQDLVRSGVTDLRGVIGCRDDIMSYLMSKGLEGHDAFVIMELVRKGKKLSEEQLALMREHDVPEYYIESCKKIKYLFPKGHACAYVMMALRVGYYKVYYPLEFYATFFTIRCDQYDLKTMVGGIDAIHDKLVEFDERRKSGNPELKLSVKEEAIQDTLQVALEMCERGYKFLNIDIEKSHAADFLVDKENKALIPPFKCLDGFGEKGAEALLKARVDKPFYSKEDLKNRGKLSSANMKQLEELHAIDNLPDDDQLSLFDFNF